MNALLPNDFRSMISSEEIARLPIQRYEGEICVIATSEALDLAMADIRQESVVGFDTETRPAFHKGEEYLPSLVQAATARRVYLMQLQHLDFSGALAELLAAPHIIKAGVALAGDLTQLKRLFPLEPVAVADLGRMAKRNGCKQTGLRNLAALFLGARIPKGARTTNWSAPRLTPAQIGYAATDAWISRELYLRFQQQGWGVRPPE
ncbi:MAG: 3'-5' exonuclease domain-containing protein 2 [Betaproteobacteria bacterium]|nr:3'-5' exonuclease domain-containing protein 2 [Betaproteobacteria bacterium]